MSKKKIVKKIKKPKIKVEVLAGKKEVVDSWKNIGEHTMVKADIKNLRTEDYISGKNDGVIAGGLWVFAFFVTILILAAIFFGR